MVWCRDVLEALADLELGVSELARVLKPGGAAVIYLFATPRLEPGEAAAFDAVGNVARNVDRATVEAAFDQAGFRVERLEELRTEFREYEEERFAAGI